MKRATMKENCAIMKTNDDFERIIIFDNDRKQLKVSEQCFEKLGRPEWVRVQMNVEKKSITLMASNQNNDCTIRVDKNTDFDGIFYYISCQTLFDDFHRLWKWEPSDVYVAQEDSFDADLPALIYGGIKPQGVEIRSGKDIQIVTIDWLWKPFIPIGRLTMIRSRQPQTALNVLSAISGILSFGIKLPTFWNGQIFDTTPMEPIQVGIMTERCCPREANTFYEANHGNSERIVWIDHLENCDMETTIVKEKLGLLIIDRKEISFENAIEGDDVDADRLERYYKRLYYTAKKTNCAIIVIDEISRIPYVGTNDYYCISSLRNIIEIRELKAGYLSYKTVKNNFPDSCYDSIMIRFDDELRLILETGFVDTRKEFLENGAYTIISNARWNTCGMNVRR